MLRDKTVILGGSFNPPHIGHQISCLYYLETLGVKEVWLVPVHSHPLGKTLVSFKHRMEMCRMLAFPFGGKVVVSDVERELGGSGRTYDLLKFLQLSYPNNQFVLSVGGDILQEVHLWHRWEDILKMIPVVVLNRSGFSTDTPVGVLNGGELVLPEISSSEIRYRLSQGGRVSGLLTSSVSEYIEAERLYGLKSPPS